MISNTILVTDSAKHKTCVSTKLTKSQANPQLYQSEQTIRRSQRKNKNVLSSEDMDQEENEYESEDEDDTKLSEKGCFKVYFVFVH